jgi:hypothetical protein
MKKTWQAPQLIILVRSKPEETVLSGCKTTHLGTGSPTVGYGSNCDHDYICWECEGLVSS